MSTPYDPSFEADFGDGTYRFRLCGIKEWTELEAKVGHPLFMIYRRLATRECGAADIYETIRFALIGGGMKPADALTLCRRYVGERPLAETLPLALRIIGTVIVGPVDLQKKSDGEDGAKTTETAA